MREGNGKKIIEEDVYRYLKKKGKIKGRELGYR